MLSYRILSEYYVPIEMTFNSSFEELETQKFDQPYTLEMYACLTILFTVKW